MLEPSAGIGHFFGLMPAALSAKSNLAGVEIDEISGRILRALYPDATVRVEGFEQQRIPNNRYDLIVTNVPFGAIKVHDTFDKDLSAKFDIHDYFIAKVYASSNRAGWGCSSPPPARSTAAQLCVTGSLPTATPIYRGCTSEYSDIQTSCGY